MKLLTTAALKAACDKARRLDLEYLMDPELEGRIDPAGRHGLVSLTLVADDRATRCNALIKLVGQTHPHIMMLDVPLADFNAGQTVSEDGVPNLGKT